MVKANPKEAAEQLAALWKIDAAIVETGNGRRSYRVGAVTREGLSEQQKIADVFFAEKVLPKEIDASQAAIWQPASQ